MTSSSSCTSCGNLQSQLQVLRKENEVLRQRLTQLTEMPRADQGDVPCSGPLPALKGDGHEATSSCVGSPAPVCCEFTKAQLERYGRQVLVQSFSVDAQRRLVDARVLVVGMGGLGSPVVMYLASMGIGTLGLVDDDVVEVSNLHRQIAHGSCSIGMAKVTSAQQTIRQLNPLVKTVEFTTRFTWQNALEITKNFDVVIDASDNPQTRYLVNDVCVFLRKPLVSGSAIGMEGQLTVLNLGEGPCYRCIYPQPEQKAMSCADNGVLGVVPGIIGTLQAMECVKVVTGVGKPLTGIQCLYDAFDGSFYRFKLPPKNKQCAACGLMGDPTKQVSLQEFLASVRPAETQAVCATSVAPRSLTPDHELSIETFALWRRTQQASYLLLDVRPPRQYDIVHFPEAVSYPLSEMKKHPDQVSSRITQLLAPKSTSSCSIDLPAAMSSVTINGRPTTSATRLLVICRRGISSVRATELLLDLGISNVCNVQGGYTLYSKQVDGSMPMY